jgi:hypothetical protein
LPDPLAVPRSFRILSDPPPSRRARCTSHPEDTPSEEEDLAGPMDAAPSSHCRSDEVDALGSCAVALPDVHCTLRRTPLPHSSSASLPRSAPSPFELSHRAACATHPKVPTSRLFSVWETETGTRVAACCSDLFPSMGFWFPSKARRPVVARSQPSLRVRAPLPPDRNLADVGSTLDPALR